MKLSIQRAIFIKNKFKKMFSSISNVYQTLKNCLTEKSNFSASEFRESILKRFTSQLTQDTIDFTRCLELQYSVILLVTKYFILNIKKNTVWKKF